VSINGRNIMRYVFDTSVIFSSITCTGSRIETYTGSQRKKYIVDKQQNLQWETRPTFHSNN
jgi:hypothetical protein